MKRLLYLILFLLTFTGSYGQLIKFPITNFTQKEYGRGQEAQNWSVVQDHNGLMYFGNANGVLEYDGRSWRFIPVKQGTYVTSLDCDRNGHIFVGAQNDFGILIPDSSGKLQYVSLADSVDKKEFSFSTIWKTIVIDSKVFFQSEEMLFVYENGKLQKIKPETSFHLAFRINNQLWIKQRNKGLFRYEAGKLEMIKNGDFYKDIGICGISKAKNNAEFLITTFDQGIYIYNTATAESKQSRFPDDHFFTSCNIYGSLKLNNGNTAINSTNKGLFIINDQGRVVSMVNEESGLQVNDVKQVFQDMHNNLWLAMNNGIARVNYTSPLSYYSQQSGISGNVYAVSSYQNQLFIGTSTGLYRQQPGQMFYKFERITGTVNQVWSLADMGSYLIVAASDGLYVYRDGNISNIIKMNCRSMYADKTNKLLFVGGNHGLAVFNLQNKPELHSFVDEITSSIVAIAKNKNSKNFIELWLGTAYQGAVRVVFDTELNAKADQFNEDDGLTEGFVLPFEQNNNIVFATSSGICNFMNEETVMKMLPDSLKKKNPNIKGYFEPLETNGKIDNRTVTFMLMQDGFSFIVYNNILNIISDGKSNSQPFSGIEFGKLNTLFIRGNMLWIGADEGLISYRLNSDINYSAIWKVLIRKIYMNDSALYFGSGKNDQVLTFKYGKNRLSFEFAGLYYDHPEKNEYSYILEGYDESWSGWNTNASVTFTGLREGKYVLKVKARNVYGVESTEESIAFEVLPPWYRTVAAYMVYAVFIGLFVWLLFVLSRLGLKRKNEYLETIVAKRTEEIRQEKDKSEKLLLNTLPLKVVDDLKMYGKTEPESFREVTAYFSDVCGFTDMSTTLDPKFLISELNDIFTAFDDIMIRNQCERIKTIGDAYLAVCGMPEPNEKHAENIINSAVEIIKYLEERNKTHELKWRIRIGINSGKVVGGIVGVRKYIYDVFGDTINTASRMESNSEPMRINVAENAYQLLKHKFKFLEREPMNVKGKGVMKMYFLEVDNN
jgi:class 3 adenylate cyclase/ligand-binding sensor domain-containing protein